MTNREKWEQSFLLAVKVGALLGACLAVVLAIALKNAGLGIMVGVSYFIGFTAMDTLFVRALYEIQ